MAAYDINPLDDEEERKRRQAIIDASDEAAMSGGGAVAPSFLDNVGNALSNRFDGAMNRVSQAGDTLMNPQQAIEQRMMNDQRQEQQQQAADTEVRTQTTKTFGDGSQERVVKTQVPVGQAQQQAQAAPMGAMMGPVSPNSPEAQQQAQQFAQAMARFQQPQAQTRNLAQQPAEQPVQQRPMGQMPPADYRLGGGQTQPGIRQPQMAPQAGQVAAAPGSSLAQLGQALGRTQPQSTPYTPTAEREVAQPALWVQSANDAGTDFYKLLDVANKNPESRDMISEKIKQSFKQQTMKDEAMDIIKDAQNGGLKGLNRLQQAIRPEKGKAKEEVTVNDYLKAVLYKRLGLDAMAADVQAKIIGKETKFGQVTLGGSNWEVETNSQGKIIRAKDDQGVIATESTLNQLRAGAQKFGSQSTSFTGGIHTVPNASGNGQDLLMPTQNSMTGQAGFTYASGPKQGQPYTGTATPQPQSVGTSFQKAVDKALVDFKTAPSTAAAKAALEKAALLDPGDNTLVNAVQQRINATSPDIFRQATQPTQATDPSAPAAPANNAARVAEAQRNIESIQREMALPKPAGFSQQSEDQRKRILRDELAKNQAIAGTPAAPAAGKSLAQQQADLKVATTKRESDIATSAAITQAEEKLPAEARGKGKASDITNQRAADENYAMIKPVADLIRQSTGSGIGSRVDDLARFFGVGTNGAQAIFQLNTMSYPFKYMIPRFEGPQSDRDTNLYVEAAGDFANPKKTQAERLAALQGMIFILKKYDKEGKNDWTYGGQDPTQQGKAEPGTTSSGNKYKKVQ